MRGYATRSRCQVLQISVSRRTNTIRHVYLALHFSVMRCDCEHAFVAFRPYIPEVAEQFHVRRMG